VEPAAALYAGFRNPPASHSIAPYWFWNGHVTEADTRRQLQAMIAQGVREATVFPWDGMEPRYLSEEFWRQLGAALEAARQLGFTLNLADDYNWPTAHLWDFGGDRAELSVVLQKRPEYRMRHLAYREWTLQSGQVWTVPESQPQIVVTARVGADERIDASTLAVQDVTRPWTAPAGQWLVTAYTVEPAVGGHNTRVDLLNPSAVRLYIDLFYRELARRFLSYFGRTLKLTIADHEGAYGSQIAWTPALWDEFRTRRGYDARPKLPLLARHSNDAAAGQSFRRDYLDVISELYAESFTKQVNEWCQKHGLRHGTSLYEEQLYIQVNAAGDMFRHWSNSSFIMIDALLERGRQPLDFREAVSAAHFDGKPVFVENQGLQGHSTYWSLEKARSGTNMILLWGANKLCPYFLYDPAKISWPPQWFLGQPAWPWFRSYSRFAQRGSYMNSSGTHVAPVAIYYPLETAFAHSDMLFTNKPHRDLVWNNTMDHVQNVYTALQLELERARLDTHIVDSRYLASAEVKGKVLRIGNEDLHALVLPPITHIDRRAAEKIRAFAAGGGHVIATGALPQELSGTSVQLFPLPVRKAFMDRLDYMNPIVVPAEISRDLAPVIRNIRQAVPEQPRISEGNGDKIHWARRRSGRVEWLWVVNDSPDPAAVRMSFPAGGDFERWDAVTGERRKLRLTAGTVALDFGPWDGFFLVRLPGSEAIPQEESKERVVSEVPASGWSFIPEQPVSVPYVKDADGKLVWLASERLSNRSWWLSGPFPYDDHRGFYTQYPPEKDEKPGGEGWTWFESPTYTITLREGLKVSRGRELGVYYASVFVHSLVERTADMVTAFADGMKAWINGEQVLSVHRHPKWLLLRDRWAERRRVRLRSGWNRVLLKIEPSLMVPTAFLFRLTEPDGRTLRDITWSRQPDSPPNVASARTQLEVEAPPGTGGFVVPAFEKSFRVFVNDDQIGSVKPGAVIGAAPAARIRFEFDAADVPERPIEFQPKQTVVDLFRWTDSRLAHYSGTALYERELDLPVLRRDERMLLDLGSVGTAAELWVNGRSVGQRAWRPFRFDITRFVHAGRNTVRVRVANSDAGWQSQGDTIYPRGSWGLRYQTELDRLPTIAPNGLEGPVRIVIASPVQRSAPAVKAAVRR
jgi:hypothetical protein